MAGRGRSRFNLLLLDEGEYLLDDYAAAYFAFAPSADPAEPLGLESKQRGRIRVCTRGIYFEPDDVRLPIVKLPYRQMPGKPLLLSSWPLAAAAPGVTRAVTADGLSPRDAVIVQVTTTQEMKANGAVGPYKFRAWEDTATGGSGTGAAVGGAGTGGGGKGGGSTPAAAASGASGAHAVGKGVGRATMVLALLHTSGSTVLPALQQLWSTQQACKSAPSGLERTTIESTVLAPRRDGPFNLTLLTDFRETPRLPATPLAVCVERVFPLVSCPGRLMLTASALYLQPIALNNVTGSDPVSRWQLRDVRRVMRRTRLQRHTGLEIFLHATIMHVPLATLTSDAGSGPITVASAVAGGADKPASASSAGADSALAAAGLRSDHPAAGTVFLEFRSPAERDHVYRLLLQLLREARGATGSAGATGTGAGSASPSTGSGGGGSGTPTGGAVGGAASVGGGAAAASSALLSTPAASVLAAASAALGLAPPTSSSSSSSSSSSLSSALDIQPGDVDDEYGDISAARMHAMTRQWQKRRISNLDYLEFLNMAAGRSYADITQYPVVPWVLADYTSRTLDLSDASVYRDLSKPVGALNAARLRQVKERYADMPTGEGYEPPFLYGTHYSTPGYVLYYLVRAMPEHMLRLQSGKFDAPDRLFSDVSGAWAGVTSTGMDVKEVIPEFYASDGSFLLTPDGAQLDLGIKQNGRRVGDVTLPPWAYDCGDFVARCREALESDIVSGALHNWIDLIFGFKQRGAEAVAADNVFYHVTYDGAVDIEAIADPATRHAMQQQIAEFGQTPRQLFIKAHPSRTAATPLAPLPVGGGATGGVGGSASTAASAGGEIGGAAAARRAIASVSAATLAAVQGVSASLPPASASGGLASLREESAAGDDDAAAAVGGAGRGRGAAASPGGVAASTNPFGAAPAATGNPFGTAPAPASAAGGSSRALPTGAKPARKAAAAAAADASAGAGGDGSDPSSAPKGKGKFPPPPPRKSGSAAIGGAGTGDPAGDGSGASGGGAPSPAAVRLAAIGGSFKTLPYTASARSVSAGDAASAAPVACADWSGIGWEAVCFELDAATGKAADTLHTDAVTCLRAAPAPPSDDDAAGAAGDGSGSPGTGSGSGPDHLRLQVWTSSRDGHVRSLALHLEESQVPVRDETLSLNAAVHPRCSIAPATPQPAHLLSPFLLLFTALAPPAAPLPVASVSPVADGRIMIAAAWDGNVYALDVATGNQLAAVKVSTATISSLAVVPLAPGAGPERASDGSLCWRYLLVAGAWDNAVTVWPLVVAQEGPVALAIRAPTEPLARLADHTAPITTVAVTSSAPASVDGGGFAVALNIASGDASGRVACYAASVVCDPLVTVDVSASAIAAAASSSSSPSSFAGVTASADLVGICDDLTADLAHAKADVFSGGISGVTAAVWVPVDVTAGLATTTGADDDEEATDAAAPLASCSTRVVVSTVDGRLCVLDTVTKPGATGGSSTSSLVLKGIIASGDVIRALAVTEDGACVIAGGSSGFVRIYSLLPLFEIGDVMTTTTATETPAAATGGGPLHVSAVSSEAIVRICVSSEALVASLSTRDDDNIEYNESVGQHALAGDAPTIRNKRSSVGKFAPQAADARRSSTRVSMSSFRARAAPGDDSPAAGAASGGGVASMDGWITSLAYVPAQPFANNKGGVSLIVAGMRNGRVAAWAGAKWKKPVRGGGGGHRATGASMSTGGGGGDAAAGTGGAAGSSEPAVEAVEEEAEEEDDDDTGFGDVLLSSRARE